MSSPSVIDWTGVHATHIKTSTARGLPTITYTDYITSTVVSSSTPILTTTSAIVSAETETNNPFSEDQWEHRIHRFLPVIIAFAIIGILAVLGSLIYLAFRFYQANDKQRRRRRQDAEETIHFEDEDKSSPISTTISNIIPWLSIPSPLHPTDERPFQQEPIRYEKADLHRLMKEETTSRRPSLAPSWLMKMLPRKFSTSTSTHPPPKRHQSMPILGRTVIDNLNVPISSTFKPIAKSSLVLVPRSEIWQDEQRRRGVNELDLWERKKSGGSTLVLDEHIIQPAPALWQFPTQQHHVYPDSPESAERRYSALQQDSRLSSTATIKEPSLSLQKKAVSRSKSEVCCCCKLYLES